MEKALEKLRIPDEYAFYLSPDTPVSKRMEAARAELMLPSEVLLGMLTLLANDEDPEVKRTAIETLMTFPQPEKILNHHTHAKIVEIIAQLRREPALDEAIIGLRSANERTVCLIASRADAKLCEQIATDHERLMLTPMVLVALHQNPACSQENVERATSYLRMLNMVPALPGNRPGETVEVDVEAEVEAALLGKASPMLEQRQKLEMFNLDAMAGPLEGFNFDFKDNDDFSFELIDAQHDNADAEVRQRIEKLIRLMSVGQRLKLAYVANRTARNILIRDSNKQISMAVVKSGRLTDGEVLIHAGNHNIASEVLREIAGNREWTRRYPIKVALVNNPRTPINVSMRMLNSLHHSDLEDVSHNRNIAAAVFSMAAKMVRNRKD